MKSQKKNAQTIKASQVIKANITATPELIGLIKAAASADQRSLSNFLVISAIERAKAMGISA